MLPYEIGSKHSALLLLIYNLSACTCCCTKALESDTRVLAYEAGRKFKVRVNTISAGPLGSRAAKAIGFIDDMIRQVRMCLVKV